MPNQPLIKQTAVIPLYTGLQSEVVDKLVQPGNGVLALENMVAHVTGELSKRPGSGTIISPSTPTIPSGGSLPSLWQFTTRGSELIRLSQMGETPIWPYPPGLNAFLNPAAGTIASPYRGPIVTSYVDVVDQVSVNSFARVPDSATAGGYRLVSYEQVSNGGRPPGIVEMIVDQSTGKPIFVNMTAFRERPRCIAIAGYLMVWFVNTDPSNIPGSIKVDVYNTASISGTPTTYTLTSSGVVDSTCLLAVVKKDANTCTVAYTTTTGQIKAIDFGPVGPSFALYDLHNSSGSSIEATTVLAWMKDLGGSGKLSLIYGNTTDGIVVEWGFGTPSAGASTASADYVIDDSVLIGTQRASQNVRGVYNVSGYTTSGSSTGQFAVYYDVLQTGDTSKATVYRGTRISSTVTKGAPFWNTASLASDFWHGPDGNVYVLTSYSNSASPSAPQNTYFVVAAEQSQPTPLAVSMPQGAGGITGRNSALPSVALGDPTVIAVPSLADLQIVNSVATPLYGVRILSITSLGTQDTSTSPPISAFGYALIPSGQLLAYDGRTLAEAVLPLRPEPPVLQATSASGPLVSITHNSGDQVIGIAQQRLVPSTGDLIIGTTTISTHTASDHVTVTGGTASYVFNAAVAGTGFGYPYNTNQFNGQDFGPDAKAIRGLADAFVGGDLVVASSGISGNDGTFTITGISIPTFGALQIDVATTTQSSGSISGSSSASISGPSSLLGSILMQQPGINNPTNDTTLAGQIINISGSDYDIGDLQLTGSGTFYAPVTRPSGVTYQQFQTTSTPDPAYFYAFGGSLPSVALKLGDPSQANQWTFAGASFDASYAGRQLAVAKALNTANNSTFNILSVISATVIVTDGAPVNEQLGATSSVTASVSAEVPETGEHSYVAVYTSVDATGRKLTSPPSLPATVTTTPTSPAVSAAVNPLAFTGRSCNVELYRAPTGQGEQYNLVASAANNPTTPASFIDVAPDDALGAELFSDGSIDPGTPIGGVSLVASFQKRVFVVSPEAPQSLFFTNPDSQGSNGNGDGLLFDTTNFSIDIIDEHGPITAMMAMDQTLVVFKADAVYAVTGFGPDGAGNNGSYQYQLIAAGVGCSNPRSLALQVGSGTQFDGIWFQSTSERSGIHTVTRGLTVEYTGQGVREFSSETIVSALVYPGQTQIRWYTVSGVTLVWDWTSKICSTFTGQACASAVLFETVPTYAPTGSLAGSVLQESGSAYLEGGFPFTQRVVSPWLSLAQLKGFERIYRIQGVGRTVGAHDLTVNLYADYDDTKLVGTFRKTFDGTSTSWNWEIRPSVQKLSALKVEIIGGNRNADPAGTAGFAITAIALVYGVKKGLSKLPDSSRMSSS